MASSTTKPAPKTSKYDDESLTKPQSTSPGDAPADTYDPLERVSSATPDKGAAAAAGHQTVNAVVEVEGITPAEHTGTRSESYTSYDSQGKEVKVTHNYDTGETSSAAAGGEG